MSVARIGFAYNPTNEQALELRERAEGWCRVRGIGNWAAPAGDLDALHARAAEHGRPGGARRATARSSARRRRSPRWTCRCWA